MKFIVLKTGEITIIDDDDYAIVSRYKWSINEKGYVVGGPYRKLHKLLIQNVPNGMQIDHINRNKLDNRKKNLRIVTPQENRCNVYPPATPSSNPSLGPSKYTGVYYDRYHQRWSSEIYFKNKRYRMGRYINEQDAALAYDLKALELDPYRYPLNCEK